MSTEPLSPEFPFLAYDEVRTGMTVRGGHTVARGTAANIVALGRPCKRIGPTPGLTTANSVRVSYARSHASITQLWVAWYYRPDPAVITGYADTTVTTTIRDALGSSITSPDATIPRGFDGQVITAVPALLSSFDNGVLGAAGYIDLDAVAVTLTDPSWDFEFAWTRSGTDVALDRVELWECGRTLVDDADASGVLVGLLNPGNPIVAGSTTTHGYERLIKTTEAAIATNRAYLNVAWTQDIAATIPVTTSASFTAFTHMLEGGVTPWPWKVRPRPLYRPSSVAGEPARVRYLFYVAGGGTAKIRCNTGATGTPYDTGSLTGASWQWSPWRDVELPTNGVDGIASVTFEGRTSAGTLYLAGIALDEAQ